MKIRALAGAARPVRRNASQRTAFYSIAAQPDNLGDVEIRRVVLGWLKESTCDLFIYAGSMPPGYLAQFDFPVGTTLTTKAWKFEFTLIVRAARRRAHLVYAPGPYEFGWDKGITNRWKGVLAYAGRLARSLTLLANVWLVGAFGGRNLAIGRAIRGYGRVPRLVEQAIVRSLDLFSTRDTVTSEVLGSDLLIIPDVAFARHPPSMGRTHRNLLVFSFRGDHPVIVEGLASAMNAARQLGLVPVLMSQVRSDDAQHRRLGHLTGCDVVAWGERCHGEQFDRIDRVFANARAVVSDRLHALVFGSVFGAAPVALVHTDNDKLTSSLRHVLPLEEIEVTGCMWPELERRLELLPAQETILACARKARDRLDVLRASVVETLAER